MEGGTNWGNWLAYGVICGFLLLVLAVFARTMMLFAMLWLMPIARVVSRLRGARRGGSRDS